MSHNNHQKETMLLNALLDECHNNNPVAQSDLYSRYSKLAYGICLRYAKNNTDAEDILQEGFIKVFKYLKDYVGKGSFEGWIRKIMITTAFNFYKKKNLINNEVDPDITFNVFPNDNEVIAMMSHEELLALIRQLPHGYKTVFNLNTIEGYTHKEISEMMNISINTSKSQLSRAKSSLRKKLESVLHFEDNMVEASLVC